MKKEWEREGGRERERERERVSPCIACIMNAKILERNSAGIEPANANTAYVRKEEANAIRRADRAPNRSPNLPKIGPPSNIAMANTVSMYPNTTGLAPKLLERNCVGEKNYDSIMEPTGCR